MNLFPYGLPGAMEALGAALVATRDAPLAAIDKIRARGKYHPADKARKELWEARQRTLARLRKVRTGISEADHVRMVRAGMKRQRRAKRRQGEVLAGGWGGSGQATARSMPTAEAA